MRVTHRGLLVSPLFHRLPTRGPRPLRSNARARSPWKRCNGQPLTCWLGSRRPNRLHTTGWRLTNRQQLVERFTVAEFAALARFYSTPEGCRWCARGSPLLRPLLRCSSPRWRLGRGLPERCRRADRRRGRQPRSLSVGTAASGAACPRLRFTEVPFEAQQRRPFEGPPA